MVKILGSQSRGPGSIPGQGTRAHMPQLSPGAAKLNIYVCMYTRVCYVASLVSDSLRPCGL